jgi:hypothetical protein
MAVTRERWRRSNSHYGTRRGRQTRRHNSIMRIAASAASPLSQYFRQTHLRHTLGLC